jgi:hypothetical protein
MWSRSSGGRSVNAVVGMVGSILKDIVKGKQNRTKVDIRRALE